MHVKGNTLYFAFVRYSDVIMLHYIFKYYIFITYSDTDSFRQLVPPLVSMNACPFSTLKIVFVSVTVHIFTMVLFPSLNPAKSFRFNSR